ncbi:hypothetical protein JX265_005433 [Neoarthrinium moseri]|uniref:Uncharacterized protein n=1 Tax=Neoarthrinium moseri TaxID=1658444 RepID=A0A9Q0ART4_9PEZI|nr:uncharacterized protein JN550_009347 [Neoarthrinium moseri]KAI1845278.1 hypothetical protein JX266_008588 [Neoarthrinium moseri]KAI1863849.1 hypothetical protein JN550_009347 [Neoarthrinium moseri]KAI1872553.1 hypothetical protein JX265_005433 [Neoarthrinium moseri]
MPTRASELFERDGTCAANWSKCSQSGLPDNFCCAAKNKCIPLAGDTTILCCPEGSDCNIIEPIVCNVQLQNATTNPEAVIKTTALNSQLPTCGNSCCPFGYSCEDSDDGKICVQDVDQSQKPAESGSGSSATSTHTSSSPATSTGAPAASATHSNDGSITSPEAPAGDVNEPAPENGANVSAIAGGVAGGIVGLAIVGVIIYGCVARRKKNQAESKRRRESDRSLVSEDALKISAPMPNQQYNNLGRSDFIARTNASAQSTPSAANEGGFQRHPQHHHNHHRSSNPFSNTYSIAETERSAPDMDERSYHASAIIDGLYSESASPSSGRRRPEDEFEDINIFADPLTVPDFTVGGAARPHTAMTRWSHLQQHAEQGKQ